MSNNVTRKTDHFPVFRFQNALLFLTNGVVSRNIIVILRLNLQRERKDRMERAVSLMDNKISKYALSLAISLK